MSCSSFKQDVQPTALPLSLSLQAARTVFTAAIGKLLRSTDLQRLHGDLRVLSRGVIRSEGELSDILGALSASPEVGLDPAEVQREVKAAFEAAQKQAAQLPGSSACSAATAAVIPVSSRVPLQPPLQQANSGPGSSPFAAWDCDPMVAQGGPWDSGVAPLGQASSWAGTAWLGDSADVEGPTGSHYSSSSSAAELPEAPFQQTSRSAPCMGWLQRLATRSCPR